MTQLNPIHYNGADDAWIAAVAALVRYGEAVSPRSMGTRELRGVQVILNNVDRNVVTNKERKLNYAFMAAEWLWMMAGRDDVGMISAYCKNIAQFSDDGKTFFGAYGPPIADQLDYVLETLRADPDSRQALLTIWRPKPPATKDVPCTVSMQFMLRNDKLEALVHMRSSDVWLGLPYDLYNFTMIQKLLAAELEVAPGCFRLWIGSSHLYERNLLGAARVLLEALNVRLEGENNQTIQFTSPRELSGGLDLVDAAATVEALARKGAAGKIRQRWDGLSTAARFVVGPMLRHLGHSSLVTGWEALEEHHDRP